MCLICKDYELKKLTRKEALTNLTEVYDEEDKHHNEVWMKLVEDELAELE